jgi:hypothetical protein
MQHKINKNDDGTVTIELSLTTITGVEVTTKLTITSLDQQSSIIKMILQAGEDEGIENEKWTYRHKAYPISNQAMAMFDPITFLSKFDPNYFMTL